MTTLFNYPKPPKLVEKIGQFIINDTPDQTAIFLDFFSGSGTTGHAVINLNREDGGKRKYILVEKADYFHTVLLPRIKKVVFSDKWRDGKAQGGKGISHLVKYFCLEQYEDVLRRVYYQDKEASNLVQDDPCIQYVFLRNPDNAETDRKTMAMDLEQNKIWANLSKLYSNIDLAETLSCVTGKWIRRIHPAQNDFTRPGMIEFEDGTVVDLQNPFWELIKPLIWW